MIRSALAVLLVAGLLTQESHAQAVHPGVQEDGLIRTAILVLAIERVVTLGTEVCGTRFASLESRLAGARQDWMTKNGSFMPIARETIATVLRKNGTPADVLKRRAEGIGAAMAQGVVQRFEEGGRADCEDLLTEIATGRLDMSEDEPPISRLSEFLARERSRAPAPAAEDSSAGRQALP